MVGAPELICNRCPLFCVVLALAAKMLNRLRTDHIRALRAGRLDHCLQLLRVLKERTRSEQVLIERLCSLISLEQRLLQTLDERLLSDVGT